MFSNLTKTHFLSVRCNKKSVRWNQSSGRRRSVESRSPATPRPLHVAYRIVRACVVHRKMVSITSASFLRQHNYTLHGRVCRPNRRRNTQIPRRYFVWCSTKCVFVQCANSYEVGYAHYSKLVNIS